ncbi:MAG: SlyX protein [Methyloprofundus sp.]|nr:SlyX protein [Methyloprofundus sp.]
MTEQRIITIETKIAFQEDIINQLNDVICKQQDQIDALEHLTQQLLGRVRDLSEASAASSAGGLSAADERPPHY